MRINASRSMKKVALAASVASLAILFATPAMAQDAQGSGEEAEAPAEGIVVIGTRRTDRTVTDSASPVDVIGAEDLSTQSASNMLDTVKNVVPSFYVGQNTISDASTFVRAPALRGLPVRPSDGLSNTPFVQCNIIIHHRASVTMTHRACRQAQSPRSEAIQPGGSLFHLAHDPLRSRAGEKCVSVLSVR